MSVFAVLVVFGMSLAILCVIVVAAHGESLIELLKERWSKSPPTCARSSYCTSWRHPHCGSGHCVEHCKLYCEGHCADPMKPKLSVMKGGK